MIGLTVWHLTLAAGALFLVGYVVLGLLLAIPSTRALGNDLLRTFITATFIAALIFVAFNAGGPVLAGLLIAMAARIGYEATHVRLGMAAARAVAILTALATAALLWTAPPLAPVALAGLWVLTTARLVFTPGPREGRIWAIADLLAFPILPLLIFVQAAQAPATSALMLATYIMVESFDSYALAWGRLIGRTPAFPRLSPRKTIEGLVGGAFMLVLTVLAVSCFIDVPPREALVGGIIVGVFTVAGDLGASRLKRNAGVKDFPVVMARQGGVLDTVDSWVAAGAGLTVLLAVLQLSA
ncbi:phosphatidate cytidylyltransferase [Salinihabitans flavidus]|uniref:Phosphatidate cytidylyltransferase n=1 Tax=Salinihabitans flavidus TaxID=569882 RepID=A0A1H8QUP9_9RHOB|nr:phosphatidate cytidylyltransferase [Salinihabitans flavidus]SEO57777.1 phosphatidate cytidylyltransferase [Salinihabitans flavidus]